MFQNIKLNVSTSMDILTLAQLQQSQIPVYLTGSRFFMNNIDPMKDLQTDWDFFTDLNQEINLVNLGFMKMTAKRAYCIGVCDVVNVYEKGKIQVQIVSNVPKKLAIQEIILKQFGGRTFNGLPKLSRTYIWRMLYEAAKLSVNNNDTKGLQDLMPF